MGSNRSGAKKKTTGKKPAKPPCFVIMPISDQEGYPSGHFLRVYEDIFRPACEEAGYTAIRADEVRETNLIHLDVLQRLLESPIALCDLSSRSPNVLFELGLRQAFDKPVVLVQETGTPPIFDIAPLRYTAYRRSRTYHEVLEDRDAIAGAIRATAQARDDGQGINSLVKLLALAQPAALPEVQDAEKNPALQLIRAELEELRFELKNFLRASKRRSPNRPYDRMGFPVQSSKLMHAAVRELDPRSAEIFVMAEGLDGRPHRSIEEIADMMGLPPRTVVRSLDESSKKIRAFMARRSDA